MKIIVTAVGSTGDIQSFVALAESLKKAGHIVKVCSYDIYKRKFDKISVPFAAVGPAIDENRVGEVRDSLKQLSPLKQLDYLVKEVFLYRGKKFYDDCIEMIALKLPGDITLGSVTVLILSGNML
jgi:UDP:flavonoid glycosyltransferase YjiC (YdhE family)